MVAAVLLLTVVAQAITAQGSGDRNDGAGAGIGTAIRAFGEWVESPAHVRLFAPTVHQSEYRAFVSHVPLDDVVRRIAAAQTGPPGAWRAQFVSPLDAFGSSGTYNRFQLVRLYVGNTARVARGPWPATGGLESWTLVSPYPSAALDAVEPGTLLIAMRVPPL